MTEKETEVKTEIIREVKETIPLSSTHITVPISAEIPVPPAKTDVIVPACTTTVAVPIESNIHIVSLDVLEHYYNEYKRISKDKTFKKEIKKHHQKLKEEAKAKVPAKVSEAGAQAATAAAAATAAPDKKSLMYSALVGAISGGISGAIVSFVVGLGASMFLSKRPQRPQEPDKEGALGKLKKSCLPLLSRKLPFQCQTYQRTTQPNWSTTPYWTPRYYYNGYNTYVPCYNRPPLPYYTTALSYKRPMPGANNGYMRKLKRMCKNVPAQPQIMPTYYC